MDIGSIGTGILFRENASKPLSVEEWEARCVALGFLADEWWFKAGSALVRWTRAAVASLVAAPQTLITRA